MIVRILGEGQYDVQDSNVETLNQLDSALEAAVDAGDDEPFRAALAALVGFVRSSGTALADDALVASDAAVPDESSTLADVRELLVGTAEGLIPG